MYDPNQYPPQPGYPQNQYPPQQPPYGQSPPQERAQRRAYRRRRRASMFQIRMGALSCIAIVAGLYLLVGGQAKNPVATFGLIGGGILVFVLVVVLPSLLSR